MPHLRSQKALLPTDTQGIRHNPAFGIAAKIVWREMVQLHPFSDPSHHLPNDVLRDSRAPGRPMAANSAEDSARGHFRRISPSIDGILDPSRHRNGT